MEDNQYAIPNANKHTLCLGNKIKSKILYKIDLLFDFIYLSKWADNSRIEKYL